MSMPELPKPHPDFTQEQALTMILSSIALEEAALSHIINAEGEKIQYILKQSCCGQCPADLCDVLAVNKSVTELLDMVLQNQMLLKNKMEKVLEHLPRPPCPPWPPCPCPPDPCPPPCPPCPPLPPCPPSCCRFEQVGCLNPIPRACCDDVRLRLKTNLWRCLSSTAGNCASPQTNTVTVNVNLGDGNRPSRWGCRAF